MLTQKFSLLPSTRGHVSAPEPFSPIKPYGSTDLRDRIERRFSRAQHHRRVASRYHAEPSI